MSDTRSGYEEVEVINDADGVCAVITRRKSNKTYSFMLAKVFDRDGTPERTSFMQRRHEMACVRLLGLACERIDQLIDRDKAEEREAQQASQARARR